MKIEYAQFAQHFDDCRHVSDGGTYHGSVRVNDGHWHDVYSYAERGSTSACFRTSSEGQDYVSPGNLLDGIKRLNERLVLPSEAMEHEEHNAVTAACYNLIMPGSVLRIDANGEWVSPSK